MDLLRTPVPPQPERGWEWGHIVADARRAVRALVCCRTVSIPWWEQQMRDVVSNEEIIQEARRKLEQGAWDYLVGGSESETTLRRNRLAFDKIALRPRVLRDVSKVDTSTTFLGQKLRIPAILAPIGSLQTFDPTGALGSTKAATEFGIMHCVSTVTQPSLEETAAATDTPKIFQLYVQGDMDWVKDLL